MAAAEERERGVEIAAATAAASSIIFLQQQILHWQWHRGEKITKVQDGSGNSCIARPMSSMRGGTVAFISLGDDGKWLMRLELHDTA